MTHSRPPLALLALTAGAFGIGVTEFVIMGLLLDVGADLRVSTSAAGLLISGYALGVVVGAPLLTVATARWPRKQVLLALMAIFVLGNAACALAPSYGLLMAARVIAALAHGTFFGVGSVVATRLVPPERKASAIAIMFTGLTVANILGVPMGTWLGQQAGWRATFWAVAAIGIVAFAVIALAVPRDREAPEATDWRRDLRVLGRRPVLLGLATTVLGYASVFAVFTYIAPLLMERSGFAAAAISPILLLFGGGLVLGNLVGGRMADRALVPTVFASLAGLLVVLVLMAPLLGSKAGALVAVAALGFAAFATVAPLQMWVMSNASGAGESLASSVNIAAFNLGNAIGAWVGGIALSAFGLGAITWAAALFPLAAIGIALLTARGRISAVPT
ncbi:MFS transporter [Sphingomonas yantingensis]|uniref:DHA1 family inner membrane transport protein n=1 Tax=Sphingomonas yantingensis TaxID=1241761 RepID=A0A7W9EK19_9SPHN|nr:MFS transporter [Sphingomonas yantingensis]MBB5699196.1 DHA1 family inner membrane transport protein [Sphingomonas yantingensis]